MGRVSAGRVLLLAFALTLAATALLPTGALARTTRAHQSSFELRNPRQLTVDQSNGDLYVATSDAVKRFDSTGTPKAFSAGPGAGTNEIPASSPTVAVDNSGGPLNGDIYITSSQGSSSYFLNVFGSNGALLGSITGSSIPKDQIGPSGKLVEFGGVAVDQADGSLYVSSRVKGNVRLWRFLPTSPSGTIDDSDYTVSGIRPSIEGSPGYLAANAGKVYAVNGVTLFMYSAASFAPDVPAVESTLVDDKPTFGVGVDPRNGDIYSDEGYQVTVFDAANTPLYRFGFAAYMGAHSTGVAAKSASSGSAERVYVADGSGGTVSTFGPVTKLSTLTRPEVAAFGKDGTASSSFGQLSSLAFDQADRKLYALQRESPGIYGFDASAPPAFPPLAAFDPVAVSTATPSSALAVDNTGLGSAGRVFLASAGFESATNLLYGFDSTGSPLGSPFPVDPAVSPGAPAGSPKRLCGTAVDSSGNVWVANGATKRILEYSSTGASLPGTFSTVGQESSWEPCRLAFDSNDNLYVAFSPLGSVWKYSAASGYTSAKRISGHRSNAIAVDPSTDDFYTLSYENSENALWYWLDEYDPSGVLLNERFFGREAPLSSITVDASNHDVYLGEDSQSGGGATKIRVFGPGVLLPETLIKPASGLSNTGATLNGTVNDQEVALTDCHFEYVTERAFELGGFSDLSSGGSSSCSQSPGSIPLDLDEHPVSATVGGLVENTTYHYRLSAANSNGATTSAESIFTSTGPPLVETTGSPVRTATSVRLDSRVDPENAAVTYHFEYGTEGPCDSSPCASTEPRQAGSGSTFELVSQKVEGLLPNTTYHYRVVADNGNIEGPAFGKDMTLTTWASNQPLSHGHFPGPAGSDRAYEQVSIADTGGNPVSGAEAVSGDGNRAFYRVHGGTPISSTGTLLSPLFAERTPTGWHSENVHPPRDQLVANNWIEPSGRGDLSSQYAFNFDLISSSAVLWRVRPGEPAVKVFQADTSEFEPPVLVSADASRVFVAVRGSHDPAHPVAGKENFNLYDVSSGSPQLVDLMPDGSVPPCGAAVSSGNIDGFQMDSFASRVNNWISPDGSRAFFPMGCGPEPQLYLRDLGAEETKLVSGPPVSGPSCGAKFIKSNEEAAFIWTESRLSSEDSAPAGCSTSTFGDGDVYRYDIASGALKCVTCIGAGVDLDVYSGNDAWRSIAVAENGSRVYFRSPHALLPGAGPGVYRVMVANGDLAYVANIGQVGDFEGTGSTINPDGSVVIFASVSPALNAVGGQQNGDTLQFYRYDDRDRSLVCVSCPQDGSLPKGNVEERLVEPSEVGANMTALSADGETFAFATPTPLTGADQNTPGTGHAPEGGTDVYEWRDGRLLLITDGLSNWPHSSAPFVSAMSPSGRDIFFVAAAQYTPDALDGYARLYDARIGGGIEFPPPPKPCPLEVCQGTPKGAPEEQAPGTGSFAGAGNVHQGAAKKKHHKKSHKHKKQGRKHRAKHERRTHR